MGSHSSSPTLGQKVQGYMINIMFALLSVYTETNFESFNWTSIQAHNVTLVYESLLHFDLVNVT